MGTKNFNSATDLITFTRASGGTALRKISYGNELVTNGDFSSGTTGWVDGTNWSGALDASSGKLLITSDSSNGYGCAIQGVPLVVGKAYRLTGSRRAVSGGNPAIGVSNSAGAVQVVLLSGSASTVTNYFSVTFVASSTFSLCLFNQSPTNGNSSEFDNISVKEVLFDQADGTLQLFNHGNNVPRIEYDATGAVKGLLIEEARTNLYLNSSDTSTNSSFGITKTSDSAVSPDGTTTADLITPDTSYPRHLFQYSSSYSAGDGSKETYSFYAKSNGYNLIEVSQRNQNGGTITKFDLSAVTATTTGGTEILKSIEDVGNGWYRCSAAYITSSVRPYPAIEFLDTDGSQGFVPDGTSGIYFWGHQLEAGGFPSSYIPTSGSTATRAADIATIPTSAFGYNQKVGSVVVEFNSNKPNNEQYGAFGLSDGSPTNRIAYYATSVNTLVVTTAGVGQVELNAGLRVTTSELVKFSAGYAENDFAASLNGATTVTDTSGTVPSGISSLGIGHYYPPNPSSNLINGHIKSIKYYPRRLTNAQLQELTT